MSVREVPLSGGGVCDSRGLTPPAESSRDGHILHPPRRKTLWCRLQDRRVRAHAILCLKLTFQLIIPPNALHALACLLHVPGEALWGKGAFLQLFLLALLAKLLQMALVLLGI